MYAVNQRNNKKLSKVFSKAINRRLQCICYTNQDLIWSRID